MGVYDDRLVIDKADLMKKFELHFPKPKTRKAYKGHLVAWLKQHPLERYERWTQRAVEAFLGEQVDEKNPSEAAQMQRRAALKWLLHGVLKLNKLDPNPFPIRRQQDKKGGHSYWDPDQIRQMLTPPREGGLKALRMSLAGHLLYEIGGRAQDLMKLTFGQFTKQQN